MRFFSSIVARMKVSSFGVFSTLIVLVLRITEEYRFMTKVFFACVTT